MAIDTLPQPVLITLFIAAAAVIWWAGMHLARAVDDLDTAFGWGQALGGMVLLAVVTNLPEIAIVASAASSGRIEVATGNLLGGIAIQTVVLALLDAWGNRGNVPLSTRAASPQLLLMGVLVIAVLGISMLGHFLPANLIALRLTPAGIMIALAWLGTLYVLRRLPANDEGVAKKNEDATKSTGAAPNKSSSTTSIARPAGMLALTAVATLGAGVLLERSGGGLASLWGMQGVVFGATVLAAATSLPELATGMAALRRKKYTLAVSDILGGNAFLPVLFVLATLLSGAAVLPAARNSDLYLTALGIVLTAIFLGGMLLQGKRKHAGMGIDAWLMIAIYGLGILGLLMLPQ